jgi:kelch repeat/BTB domain-containing protein 8
MRETSEFTDCELVIKGHIIKCHRAVLAQVSPVFRQMFSGGMMEANAQRVQLEDVEKEVVHEFLAFVYTGELNCQSENFPGLLKLADYYQLNCFTGEAAEKIVDAVDKDNIIPVLRLLKGMRERPHITSHWKALLGKVQACSELTAALVAEVA